MKARPTYHIPNPPFDETFIGETSEASSKQCSTSSPHGYVNEVAPIRSAHCGHPNARLFI
jgi:hypothetical protein